MSVHSPQKRSEDSFDDSFPSWAEISSLSDDELYDLFTKSTHVFAPPGDLMFRRPTSIRRIASDAVMKVGPLEESEMLAMALVRDTTTIPVPVILRVFPLGPIRKALVMEYIPGQTLRDCWKDLGLWRRIWVVWTIRNYIRQLRRVVVPGIPPTTQPPGPLGNEPKICRGCMFNEDGAGPFSSYQELTAWFMHKLDVNRRIRKTPTEDVKFDSSYPLVLTHLDLHPNNIIVDTKSRVWLVDWEFSGFYPQWFEYVEMQHGWEILGGERWRVWVLGFMAGFYARQTRFLSSISWAVQTGFLL